MKNRFRIVKQGLIEEDFIDLTPAMTDEEIEAAVAETHCPKNETDAMRTAAAILGKKGGSAKSAKKTAAVRQNAKKSWDKRKEKKP